MKVFCHRAGNNAALLPDLKKAGFTTIEGDVMFARAMPIMVHPAGLPSRLPDGHLNYSAEQVRNILREKGTQMPTLPEMLTMIQELDMHLLLEVKVPGTVDLISDTLRPHAGRVTLISFLGEELVEASGIQSFKPPLGTGALMAHAPTRAVAMAMVQDYGLRMALMDHWYLTEHSVWSFKQPASAHIPVVAYTVNDLERARVMRDLGVDAILSDEPRALVDQAGGWLQPG